MVNAVNFGANRLNRRPWTKTESRPAASPIAGAMVEYEKGLEGRFSIPESDSLHSDLTSVGYKYANDGKLLLEAKEDMKSAACFPG